MGRVISRGPKNWVKWSCDYSQAYWIKQGDAAITSDAGVAPDGSLADRYSSTGGGYANRLEILANTYYQPYSGNTCISVMAKEVLSCSNITLLSYIWGGIGTKHRAEFNISTGSVIALTTGYSADILNKGNGWYQIYISSISTLPGNANIQLFNTAGSPISCYLWNFQWNEGLVPDSIVITNETQRS